DGRVGVEGTPADCVRLALHHLEPAADWVLAGINAGGNLGADVYHSGTVAAAREAVLPGRPAAALAHHIPRGRAVDWPRAAGRGRGGAVPGRGGGPGGGPRPPWEPPPPPPRARPRGTPGPPPPRGPSPRAPPAMGGGGPGRPTGATTPPAPAGPAATSTSASA